MKTVSILHFALAAAVSASTFQPRDDSRVSIGLSNDLTRSYAARDFATDGLPHSIGVFFAGTPLMGEDGIVYASSAQLATIPSGISCEISNNGTVIATLDAENTYADLDGNPDESIPVNLSSGRITCNV